MVLLIKWQVDQRLFEVTLRRQTLETKVGVYLLKKEGIRYVSNKFSIASCCIVVSQIRRLCFFLGAEVASDPDRARIPPSSEESSSLSEIIKL